MLSANSKSMRQVGKAQDAGFGKKLFQKPARRAKQVESDSSCNILQTSLGQAMVTGMANVANPKYPLKTAGKTPGFRIGVPLIIEKIRPEQLEIWQSLPLELRTGHQRRCHKAQNSGQEFLQEEVLQPSSRDSSDT
ncbi:MAG: hypothetical protein JXB07_03190 [Anaerolineae bacterium]|nr:hypothetical protein [Anaerolineae bacterium]